MDRGQVYSTKRTSGVYWCGDAIGWVNCRFCALRMSRTEAHVRAHSWHGAKVVIIRSPSSHALTSPPRTTEAK
jgi:hypothetical protein